MEASIFILFSIWGSLRYGLKDIEKSLIKGTPAKHSYERPFGEQSPENWYWGNNGDWDDREAYADLMLKSMSSED
jgi:hypothetical protein